MKKILFAVALCSALFGKPLVTTTILPTQYFVEQIAGDTLEVEALVGKGADPHTYEPKPNQMKSVEKSELHFAVGMEFDEIWLPRLKKQFPNLEIVQTQKGIEKIAMAPHSHAHHDHDHNDHDSIEAISDNHHDEHHHHNHEGHDHAHHHDHDHSGLDPHVWLDPVLVKTQAKNILDALKVKYPENSKIYDENYAKFIKVLDELDSDIKQKLSNLKTNKFVVYHPSWGYFAKRYNLVQISIEIEGKEPKPADLKELIDEIKEESIKVVFVVPQFSKKSAKVIASEANANVVEIDQLPKEWLDEMKKTVSVFEKALK
ncbi:metal ABC transporter solute-binding protein, Zn/Mn family [Campylobacter corcagiensis]|uniref:Zinc ABC transporter substrate-binding protein n=1 Tax=Campylobacter corcagiensis TaxID=1448857 RepID=A0A7M1LH27_9BACT|nr:zinc ABC transporter substrate-binding protein [Campylobacter corcagiensis]QKF63927.1 metal ion ABC transporter, periplasmic metal-binding protein [Campylobacter corcagiensis]QOQ87868.1 zinc ABC transporter substrate-binding protein [Campylobacter corcagiensis]